MIDAVTLSPLDRPLPPDVESRLPARFRVWLPWVLMRRDGFPSRRATVDHFTRVHRQAVIECLAAGLDWKHIVAGNLDDPTTPPVQRWMSIGLAADDLRRRSRAARS